MTDGPTSKETMGQGVARRKFLQGTAVGVVAVGIGGLGVAKATGAAAAPAPISEEIYKGHKIEVVADFAKNDSHHGLDRKALIDGVELHVMVLDDGQFITAQSHYNPQPTLQLAARAAVDNIGQDGKLHPWRR
ncbi:tyrosinase family oxidase copper chaperone [Nonomuraea typhae]|uniref:Tyrosinase family oxidase copper chaperone n=1 Tax=Nonomuraea typhae TaxID=2603600 RepID=A0ABW7YXC5_9ACTN